MTRIEAITELCESFIQFMKDENAGWADIYFIDKESGNKWTYQMFYDALKTDNVPDIFTVNPIDLYLKETSNE